MATNVKVVLVGEAGVGKTALVNRALGRNFDPKYIATLGVKVCPLDNGRFNVWDTAGQEKFAGLSDGYYLEADIGIIVADASSKLTCKSLESWYNKLQRPNIKIGVILNKMDCAKPDAVALYEAFCNAHIDEIKCITTCTKTENGRLINMMRLLAAAAN